MIQLHSIDKADSVVNGEDMDTSDATVPHTGEAEESANVHEGDFLFHIYFHFHLPNFILTLAKHSPNTPSMKKLL